jgi:hypothetical protein
MRSQGWQSEARSMINGLTFTATLRKSIALQTPIRGSRLDAHSLRRFTNADVCRAVLR